LIFKDATVDGVKALKENLEVYAQSSGQEINFDKSGVFFSSNINQNKREEVCRILGVNCINLKKYLGLSAMVGHNKKRAFKELKERLIKRAIHLYAMNCFLLPSSVCKELKVFIARFWWQKKAGRKGLHWCSWKELYVPKEEGDGVSRLVQVQYCIISEAGLKPNGKPRIANSAVAGTEFVSDLILQNPKRWNRDLIYSTFTVEEAYQIVSIPIPITNQSDKVVWSNENSGIYSVKSGYKMLLDPPNKKKQSIEEVVTFTSGFGMEYRGSTLTLKHPKPQSMVKWMPPPHNLVRSVVIAEATAVLHGLQFALDLGFT
ncbi:hypothetical protein Gotri_027355, partial [Gossypium trilobum]|nr:hypothetical protein [Gossypium trilobum]